MADDTAFESLRRTRVKLLLRHPFLATATLRVPFKAVPPGDWCPTMATDGYHIFYNAEWVAELGDEALVGVIAHEVLHVVFGHSDRRGQRDMKVWNAAADYAINLLLTDQGIELPKDGLLDRRYHGLSTEEIYDKLLEEIAEANAKGGARYAALVGGISGTAILPKLSGGALAGDVLDPADARCTALADEDAPDAENRRLMRRQLLSDLKAQLQGLGAGMHAEEIGRAEHAPAPWHLLLRHWLNARVKADWRSPPYSKRHVHRGLYMPSASIKAPAHLVVAVDTSGSMGADVLAVGFEEIRAMREAYPSRLTVLQCDAAIQRVDEYGTEDGTPIPDYVSAEGRGGTDFRPVFDWVEGEDTGLAPPVLIYFTDGEGTFPKGPPSVPVIWLVSKKADGNVKFPFGECVKV